MRQLELPLLARVVGPAVVPTALVDMCQTYREAVAMCWIKRHDKTMTQRSLAEKAGLYPSQVSDYLSDDESRREMPAKHIPAFEQVCGNTAISQWLAARARLTVIEEISANKAAA